MESHTLDTEFGIFHYKVAADNPDNLPVTLFLHGGSPKSQHTEFWVDILPIITRFTFPILTDRFGHGKSTGTGGLNANDKVLSVIFDKYLAMNEQDRGYIIGRSAGGVFAIRQFLNSPDSVAGLGLIAPGSLKTYGPKLSDISIPIHLLWDLNDPVVTFSNFSNLNHISTSLYSIGHDEQSYVSIDATSKGTHVPELEYTDLFEQFLRDLVS